jgi:creatinine amidohydrolase
MRIAAMNWMQVEEQLKRDDRAVLPIGCTEQHAYLSLATDSILAERVAAEAAEPLGVPVFPVVGYGITPNFRAFPGTVSLRIETLIAIVRDVLDELSTQGFRRILVVNGHGGNSPAQSYVAEWMGTRPGTRVRWHNWWNAPRVMAKVQAIDRVASHASWMENFAWTRLSGVTPPDRQKPLVDFAAMSGRDAKAMRELIGDGNFGGYYVRADTDMEQVWRAAVEETRQLIADGWA